MATGGKSPCPRFIHLAVANVHPVGLIPDEIMAKVIMSKLDPLRNKAGPITKKSLINHVSNTRIALDS
jgi:hypothetical protein